MAKRSTNVVPLAVVEPVPFGQALRELYPDAGFGETLLIDGTLVPAWCEQKGDGANDEIEAQRRRTCPDARCCRPAAAPCWTRCPKSA